MASLRGLTPLSDAQNHISSLPLPPIRQNRSFVKLAQLLGIGKAQSLSSSPGAGTGSASGSGSASTFKHPTQRESVHEDELEDGDDGVQDVEDEADDLDDVDEEGLMWDAQTALIAHQPHLAIQHYTTAALPPYRSSAACLALGNLLTRGSGLAPSASSSSPQSKGKQRALSMASTTDPPTRRSTSDATDSPDGPEMLTGRPIAAIPSPKQNPVSRVFSYLFSSPSEVHQAATSSATPLSSPPERRNFDLVASGWAIPNDGKRAVRDVEGMGVAGGWLILGLGWLVEGQSERDSRMSEGSSQGKGNFGGPGDGIFVRSESIAVPEDAVIISGRTKGRNAGRQIALKAAQVPAAAPKTSRSNSGLSLDADSIAEEATVSESTEESTMIKTPGTGTSGEQAVDDQPKLLELDALKLMHDLLQPLLRLYRHGHIQAHDPVALPPIASSQLPSCLKPQGDKDKGKNVWYLGGVVSRKLLALRLLRDRQGEGSESRTKRQRSAACFIMASYILGMTSTGPSAEDWFRRIIGQGYCGLEFPDELVRQAAKRLHIITRTPDVASTAMSSKDGFPFPKPTSTTVNLKPPAHSGMNSKASLSSRQRHSKREASVASTQSMFSAPHILATPLKSSASTASLAALKTLESPSPTKSATTSTSAMSTLRRVQAKSRVKVDNDAIDSRTEATQDEAYWPVLTGWTMRKTLSPPDTAVTTPEADPASPSVDEEPRNHPRERSDQSDMTITPVNYRRSHKSTLSVTTDIPSAKVPVLRPVASSPQLPALQLQTTSIASGCSTPGAPCQRRRLPFEPSPDQQIAGIDPALAAAELASALTKHVACGVCEAEGVNFPECRRCGLTFCSRACRIGDKAAGDGKRHICGAWASRKLLSVPATPARRLSKTAASPVRSAVPVC